MKIKNRKKNARFNLMKPEGCICLSGKPSVKCPIHSKIQNENKNNS